MDLYFGQKKQFEVKSILMMKLCRVIVDFCDVFISCLDSLQNGFSKSVLMNKQPHLHLGCSEGESVFSI